LALKHPVNSPGSYRQQSWHCNILWTAQNLPDSRAGIKNILWTA
jgi:hypothetical protein